MQLPLRVALVITIILIAGAGATPASAGEYAVYACDPAHGNVNNSWQCLSNRRGILVYVACTRHRGSLGALGPRTRHSSDGEPKGQASQDPTRSLGALDIPGASRSDARRASASSAPYCGKYGLTRRCF